MDNLPNKDLFRPDEVAEYFCLKTVKTVYRWCESGVIDFVKVGGAVRIRRASIVALVEKEKAPANRG